VSNTRGQGPSNRLRNSTVELRPALQAQTVDWSRSAAKLSVCLRRQTVRPSVERGKGSRGFVRAVHVSSRVLRFRPRDSITRRPIWTFGCNL